MMAQPRQFDHSIDEIKAALNGRAVELAHALGLSGRLSGRNYWVKDPRRPDGGNFSSFAIHTDRGIWKDWSQDEGGDLIRLAAVFACGGDDRRAVKWCLDWLGWSASKPDARQAQALKEKAAAADAAAREQEARRRRVAQAIWLGGKKLDGRDPASLYLRGRGIDLSRFHSGYPNSLRFVAECDAQPEGVKLPAMVACIAREDVGIMAVHRTYLAQDRGQWVKAFAGQMRDGKKVAAKRVLGAYAGGSIRLTRGASGKRLGDAPAGEWIAIGEGIENVLTVAQVRPDLRCMAAVSLSNLGNVVLPKQIGGVYVLADNDTNPATVAAFDRAMDGLALRGHEPVIVRVGTEFKDINDAFRGAA
jgi:hypothetical protein